MNNRSFLLILSFSILVQHVTANTGKNGAPVQQEKPGTVYIPLNECEKEAKMAEGGQTANCCRQYKSLSYCKSINCKTSRGLDGQYCQGQVVKGATVCCEDAAKCTHVKNDPDGEKPQCYIPGKGVEKFWEQDGRVYYGGGVLPLILIWAGNGATLTSEAWEAVLVILKQWARITDPATCIKTLTDGCVDMLTLNYKISNPIGFIEAVKKGCEVNAGLACLGL